MQNLGLIEKIQNLAPETAREVEDFVDSLTEKQRAGQQRHEALLAFAQEYGGSEFDLDEELEAAGIEHLLKTTEYK